MNKYINYRELLEILELAKEDVLQKDIRVENKLLMLYGLNYAIVTIENTSPADAQPVRHGRWKLVGADSRVRGGTWICTACNTCQPYVSDYCPHCGAKMDGGEDDGQAD